MNVLNTIRAVLNHIAELLGLRAPQTYAAAPAPAYAGVPSYSAPMQSTAPATASVPLVWHRERAAGLNAKLIAFLDEWDRSGPFPVTIPADGGLRTDDAQQAELYAKGVTNAASLKDTPHGRGAALDLYPAIVKTNSKGVPYVAEIYLAEPQKGVEASRIRPDLFRTMQLRAKAAGLEVGGDWKNLYGFGAEGDAPHIQVPNWRALPVPGKAVA